MKKAFIFTLDALFAVTILMAFFVVYSFEMNVPKETYWLPVMAQSMMTSLDVQDTFFHTFGQDDVQIQSTMNSYLDILPPNIKSQITIRIYTTSGDTFTLFRTIQTSRGTVGDADRTYARRVFIDMNEKRFGTAELVLSYG